MSENSKQPDDKARTLRNKYLTAQLQIGRNAHIKVAFEKGILSEQDRLDFIEMFKGMGLHQTAETLEKLTLSALERAEIL